MSEKIDKLRASLEKEKERRIKINNRIESLERRIQEAEAAEVNEMVRTAKVTPEQLAALLRQSATSTPNPAALSAVGATIDKEDPDNEDDESGLLLPFPWSRAQSLCLPSGILSGIFSRPVCCGFWPMCCLRRTTNRRC